MDDYFVQSFDTDRQPPTLSETHLENLFRFFFFLNVHRALK